MPKGVYEHLHTTYVEDFCIKGFQQKEEKVHSVNCTLLTFMSYMALEFRGEM
jgi:hypothetical protein